ncbi:MAG: Uncharacterised protein [Prochlorococcus marinus str. MIT 9215]|nr:MAG: Uncharacterised protein [Prochlorococcus marinus str. MIT 9215]
MDTAPAVAPTFTAHKAGLLQSLEAVIAGSDRLLKIP